MNAATDILSRLQSGDESALTVLYRQYRAPFVAWAMRHYACREADALDAFQDSVIIFYEQVASGRITSLHSSVQTYLFAIGKNRLTGHYRSRSRVTTGIDTLARELATPPTEPDDTLPLLLDLIQGLGEPCARILYWYYFLRFSMEAIAERLAYRSPDVAKTQKNRCLNRLRPQAQAWLR